MKYATAATWVKTSFQFTEVKICSSNTGLAFAAMNPITHAGGNLTPQSSSN